MIVSHSESSDVFNCLDRSFADFICRRTGHHDPAVWLAAALVSHSTAQGDVCLDLPSLAGKVLPSDSSDTSPLSTPDLLSWRDRLMAHPAVGQPGEERPLVLDSQDRLYLHRYWDYEQVLARSIRSAARAALSEFIDESRLAAGLTRLFGETREGEIDWQKLAACTAVLKRFCIITGGPGTGKTTTVAKVLALLLEQPAYRSSRIALTAPTGKAAARLEEAIGAAKRSLSGEDAVLEAIPAEASTIHRLLGSIPGSPYFRHNEDRLLPVDLVVVDEASMVDLALMAKLVSALPADARLILLGDKDQLASVEAGAVLGDLCDTGSSHGFSNGFAAQLRRMTGMDMAGKEEPAPAVRDCIVELKRSHRFGAMSGIGALARAINEGLPALALEHLESGRFHDIEWRRLPSSDQLPGVLRSDLLEGFRRYFEAEDLAEKLREFGRFRILCALRQGPYGVIALNGLTEQVWRDAGRIQRSLWYAGRPIMISTNDYNLRLFNGDIGIVGPESWSAGTGESPVPRELKAHFTDTKGNARLFPTPRVPAHETAYALTVHKSQGSEFDVVHLILPDRDSPVLTRELLYTAVTRAKERVILWGRKDVFTRAVARRMRRSSGLRDALWIAECDSE